MYTYIYHSQTGLQGVAQIDSSSLDFTRGAREASNRSVLDIHEDCERARNKAENQNAKSISLNLMKNHGLLKLCASLMLTHARSL